MRQVTTSTANSATAPPADDGPPLRRCSRVNDGIAATIGRETGLALRAGGAIWGWGNNSYRTVGTTDSANRPVGSPGWVAVEATPYATRGR